VGYRLDPNGGGGSAVMDYNLFDVSQRSSGVLFAGVSWQLLNDILDGRL
jgi:hypothetical protein